LVAKCEVEQWLPDLRLNLDYCNSVTAQRSHGSGVLLELMHEFDYLRWLFEQPSWVMDQVSKRSALEIDVEDSPQILFGMGADSVRGDLVGAL